MTITIISHTKHVMRGTLTILLSLKLIVETSGLIFQPSRRIQASANTRLFARCPIISSIRKHSKPSCLWSASVASTSDVAVSTASDTSEDHPPRCPTYDWDEQFEELQLFMSEYGHCNFPQNPPGELKKKYPISLARFCHDQRIEYKQLQ